MLNPDIYFGIFIHVTCFSNAIMGRAGSFFWADLVATSFHATTLAWKRKGSSTETTW